MLRLFRRRAPAETRSTLDLSVWRPLLGGVASSGVAVSAETALQVTTVLACVRRVADDVAKLPLEVHRRDASGRDAPARDAPIFDVLGRAPNMRHSSFEFRWTMTARAMIWGEALAVVVREGGRVRSLWPIAPTAWSVEEQPDWSLVYRVAMAGGRSVTLGASDVLHLRRTPFDGYRGLRSWALAREAIGLAAAAESGQAKVFGNGSRPSGVLTTDQPLPAETVANLRDQWRAATSGQNMFGVPVLDNGLKWQPMALSATDAQAIETRKHQVVEICAALGVLPAVLGVDDKTQAFASVEAMMRAHLSHTVDPWLECWVQALDRDVLDGGGPLHARFDRTRMERASQKEQAEADRSMIESGLRTPNEIRARDGLPPLLGGDAAWRPLNMGGGNDDAAA